MKKPLARTILYIFILSILLVGLSVLTNPASDHIQPLNGIANISDIDDDALIEIDTRGWEYYPEHFYTPADFYAGTTEAPLYTGDSSLADYGTFRIKLHLIPDKTYAITGHSFNFSQRVYIDGVFIDEIGTPGTTRETTTPHSRSYEYTFTTQEEMTEIVIHAASFYHRAGAGNALIKLGSPAAIGQWRQAESVHTLAICGGLLTVFIYYLGMYIFFSGRSYFLHIAFTALMMAVRIMLTGEKHIMGLFPDLSWFTAIRLEYLCNSLFVIFLLMYFKTLYFNSINKNLVRGIISLLGIYIFIIVFCDTLFSTKLIGIYTTLWVCASLVALWGMLRNMKKNDLHSILILIGLFVFVISACFDEISYAFHKIRIYNTIITGTSICILMNMIALTLHFSKVESDFNESKRQQLLLDQENALLDKLNRTKTQFMENISHEMKTPLTVMSTNTQLSIALLSKGTPTENITPYLDTVVHETERLARLMDHVLNLHTGHEMAYEMTTVSMPLLLENCAKVYKPMLQKKGNQLIVNIEHRLPDISGIPDMLTQVILNLLSNANRHTRQGSITLTAARQKDVILVTVRDTGEGITTDLLPRVFERGVQAESKDGRGLGLSICQDIISQHHGTITIDSLPERGTCVYFTLPLAKKEIKDEQNHSSR